MLVSAFVELASFRLTAFDTNDNQLGSYKLSQPNFDDAVFMGWESDSGIGSIAVQKFDGHPGTIWVLDDVRFESVNAVPEPSSLALLGIASLTCIGCWRRRPPITGMQQINPKRGSSP